MSASPEQVTELNGQFEAVDVLARQYAQDLSTINYVEIESLPLVLGKEEHGAPALIVSCSQVAEYAAWSSIYRMHVATATFGLANGPIIPSIERAGMDWKDILIPGAGEGVASFSSLNEFGFGRHVVLDRYEDPFNTLKQKATDAAIEPADEPTFPGMRRIISMLGQIQTSRRRFTEADRTRSQSFDDFEAVENFINHIGIGRIAVANLIPLPPDTRDANFGIVEMRQTRSYDLDGSPVETVIDISVQDHDIDTPIHHQEETIDGQRVMRINNGQALAAYLGDLELAARSKPIGAADIVNTALTQQHINRLLGKFDDLSLLDVNTVSAVA